MLEIPTNLHNGFQQVTANEVAAAKAALYDANATHWRSIDALASRLALPESRARLVLALWALFGVDPEDRVNCIGWGDHAGLFDDVSTSERLEWFEFNSPPIFAGRWSASQAGRALPPRDLQRVQQGVLYVIWDTRCAFELEAVYRIVDHVDRCLPPGASFAIATVYERGPARLPQCVGMLVRRRKS